MKFKKLNLVILALVFAAVFAWVIYKDGAENLLAMFRMINVLWLFCAMGLMAVYWLMEAQILHGVIRCFHPAQRFRNSLSTSMIGQLFNCVTPFSSGGQPVQAYHMVKTGVPLGVAGGSLMIKFIIYQFCLTVYSLVILVFFWKPLSAQVSGFSYLVLVGFVINFAVMIGLLSICFFRKFTARISHGLVKLLAKIHLLKDPERVLIYIDGELRDFHKSFAEIRRHIGTMLLAALFSLVQLTVFFLIPYFICLAFGIRGLSPLLVLAAQSFVTMISSFVPLPGAAGGAEFSFHTFFQPFFATAGPGVSLNLAMLLWRFITFYLPILVGGCFLADASQRFEQKKAGAVPVQESVSAERPR